MRTLIICILLVLTVSCSGQNKSATKKSLPYFDSLLTTYKTMPTYYVDYGNEDCLFELRINDILVDELTQPGTIGGTSATINPYITRSGKQKVSFKLYPFPGKTMIKSSMNQVYPYYKPFWLAINYIDIKPAEENQTITDVYKMPPLITPKEGIPYYEFEAEFEAEVPYQIEGSDNCIDLREVPDIEKRVVAEFERVRQLMIDHKFNELEAYFSQRDQESAISMFQTNEMRADDWSETVSDIKDASLSDWQPIEEYRLEFNSDGRSVTLRSKKKKGFPSALLWIKQKKGETKWNATCFELHLGIKKGTDKLVPIIA